MNIFSENSHVFRRLNLDIALAIPALNDDDTKALL